MSKKKLLGCSFPVFIIIAVALLAMVLVSFLGGPIGGKLLSKMGVDFHLPKVGGVDLLSVERPKPELPAEALFHVGGFPVTNTLVTSWITILILLLISLFATRKMKLVPSRLQTALEFAVGALLDLSMSIAGPKYGRKVFPIAATIFLFIFINAWTSLIPGYGSITYHVTHLGEVLNVPLLRGANTDVNVPLALAFVAFFTVGFIGFGAFGIRYINKFFQLGKIGSGFSDLFKGNFKGALGKFGFGIIDFFVGILELISEYIRLVSFTFRLLGNMFAGEILLMSIAFLVPWVLSVAFYGLEMLVGFVQALAFCLLTLIFTSMAVAGHSEEEHAEGEKAETHS